MRLRVDAPFQPASQTFDFGFRQHRGTSVETYQSHHPWQLQHPQALAWIDTDKNITGKERQLNFLSTVRPTSPALVERQKTIDISLLQLPRHRLLMPSVGVGGVPVRVSRAHRGREQRTGRIKDGYGSRHGISKPSYSFAPSLTGGM